MVLARAFRSGDLVRGWATLYLAQTRLARLSEVERKPGSVERDFSSRREVLSSE